VAEQLERIRRFYDKDPERYDRSTRSGFDRRLLDEARAEIGSLVRGKVLEVGIGSGAQIPFYDRSIELTGIDLSPRMLEVARRNAGADGRGVDLREMDAQRLAFSDASFDAVAFSLCLCTIPDPSLAVREGIRVARAGAPMVFLEHVRSHVLPIALLQDAVNPLSVRLQQDHFNRRTEDVVRAAGVQIKSSRRWLLGCFQMIVGTAPRASACEPTVC
jgi:ubiquinone/menaquinone biosynthesis C-methylase UbiE